MACCILMAAVWGCLYGLQAVRVCTVRRSCAAQAWRLVNKKDEK